jgi:BMFP domain-containing protein YqiC
MNNEVERYVGELRELRARVKELEARSNLGEWHSQKFPEKETFFYNTLK